jgi:hypothetical protein
MCEEALWLRHGKAVDQGDPKRVVDAYLTYVAGGEEESLAAGERRAQAEASGGLAAPDAPAHGSPSAAGARAARWGGREVEIRSLRLLDAHGRERHVFVPGESLTLALSVHAETAVEDFVFGVGLSSADGTNVYGTNTDIERFEPTRLLGDAEVRLTLDGLSLVEGTYFVDVAAHRKDGTPYDYHRGLHSFRVKSRIKDVGLYRPGHRWSFEGGVEIASPELRPELDVSDEPV